MEIPGAPLVYILVLNWNDSNNTVCCVKSLEQLNYKNYKVVIIDNGSIDDSVQRFTKELSDHIILKNDANLGYGAGNNRGILYSLNCGADYIWVLNNDTIVYPDSLCNLVELIIKNKNIGALGSVLYYYDNPHQIQAWGGGKINKYCGFSKHFKSQPKKINDIDYIMGASLFLSSEAIKSVGMFDEAYFMYWEDVDLCYRFVRAGWNISVAGNSKVLHKESASLGPRNSLLVRYYNFSAVIFCSKHLNYALVPIMVGFGGRLTKAIARCDSYNVMSVWKGFVDGLKAVLSIR